METDRAEIEQLTFQIEQFAKENELVLAKKSNIQQGQQAQREIEALRLNIDQLRKEKRRAISKKYC